MPVLKNPKHERFAQELAKGKTAEEAYRQAGYAPSLKNAQRLKSFEGIRSRTEEILNKSATKAGITIDKITKELAKIGFSDIRKSVKWGSELSLYNESGDLHIINGVALIDSDKIDDETAGAISEISQTKDGMKIKFHDKRAALVDLGKHLGMFKNTLELSVDSKLSDLVLASLVKQEK